MWPFRHQTSNSDLLERLESLERRFKTLLADVDEYFHLVRRAENRMKKKEAILEPTEPPTPGEEDGVKISLGSQAGRRLSPHQVEVQQQILKRRAGIQ